MIQETRAMGDEAYGTPPTMDTKHGLHPVYSQRKNPASRRIELSLFLSSTHRAASCDRRAAPQGSGGFSIIFPKRHIELRRVSYQMPRGGERCDETISVSHAFAALHAHCAATFQAATVPGEVFADCGGEGSSGGWWPWLQWADSVGSDFYTATS